MRIISARLSVPPGAFVFHQSCRTTLYRNLIDALCDAAHVDPSGYRSKFSQQGSKARNFGGPARAPYTRAYARARIGCKNSYGQLPTDIEPVFPECIERFDVTLPDK